MDNMEPTKDESPDFVLFEKKSFSDLMQDIYVTSKKKEVQIHGLIEQLRTMVSTVQDAEVAVPLIKEYLDVAVRNDEQLVKLAAVVQRHLAAFQKAKSGTATADGFLSDEEKSQLLEIALEQELKSLAQGN